jgi:hypothetical protein
MIRKILFVTSLFVAGFASAQSLQLLDENDNDISGTTHYEYGDLAALALTKFHVKNLTGATQAFALKVTLEYTPSANSGLAVCFGTACYSASGTVMATQIINSGVGDNIAGNAIYTDLKVSPVTWPWINCATDSAIWRVTAYDPASPGDSTSSRIIWRCDATVSIDEEMNVATLNAYPNPATDYLTIRYVLEGNTNNARMDLYDVLGQKVTSHALNSNKGQVNLKVDNLNAGVYFYSIKVDNKAIRTERVIVK